MNIGIKLVEKAKEKKQKISPEFFDTMNLFFSSTQNWRQLQTLCEYMDESNALLPFQSLNTLYNNILYCYDQQTRGNIKYAMKQVEKKYEELNRQ